MTSSLLRPPFLVRFAALDLFGRTSWATTFAALVTIAAAVGFAVLSRGLALGAFDVQVKRLDRDPTNRTLWFGNDSSAIMTPGRVEEIARAVAASLPPGGLEGVYPFSRTADDWEWITADGAGTQSRIIGRTLRPDDRFLESYPVRGSSSMERLTDESRGIVAAPSMLRMLGYPDPNPGQPGDSSPTVLLLQRRTDGKRIRVPLLGVARNDFPSFVYVDYAIGEAYEAELRRENPDLTLKEFRTGPVPESWAKAADERASRGSWRS